jgi:hypothetical protein
MHSALRQKVSSPSGPRRNRNGSGSGAQSRSRVHLPQSSPNCFKQSQRIFRSFLALGILQYDPPCISTLTGLSNDKGHDIDGHEYCRLGKR